MARIVTSKQRMKSPNVASLFFFQKLVRMFISFVCRGLLCCLGNNTVNSSKAFFRQHTPFSSFLRKDKRTTNFHNIKPEVHSHQSNLKKAGQPHALGNSSDLKGDVRFVWRKKKNPFKFLSWRISQSCKNIAFAATCLALHMAACSFACFCHKCWECLWVFFFSKLQKPAPLASFQNKLFAILCLKPVLDCWKFLTLASKWTFALEKLGQVGLGMASFLIFKFLGCCDLSLLVTIFLCIRWMSLSEAFLKKCLQKEQTHNLMKGVPKTRCRSLMRIHSAFASFQNRCSKASSSFHQNKEFLF